MVWKQPPPYAVQIELAEGCNLRCSFCGINGIRTQERAYKFMTPKTAEVVARKLAAGGWNSRIEFAMHGEPTMNPDAAKIVAIFRRHLPKASMLMLSNGGGLLPNADDHIAGLFDAGLNTLGLDEYQNVKLVPKILDSLPEDYWRTYEIERYTYPDQPHGNPHVRQHPKSRRLVHIRPIDINEKGTHATLNNHAGAGAPKSAAGAGKRCAKPFREMSVRWDGGVAICCNDWRGELGLGNLVKDELDAIWNGPVAQAARRKLMAGQRTFGPCQGCDATSYRVGLLPDAKGNVTLPKPTKADDAILATALAKKPMTKPVRREWEKK